MRGSSDKVKISPSGELGWYFKEGKSPGDAKYQKFEKWGQRASVSQGLVGSKYDKVAISPEVKEEHTYVRCLGKHLARQPLWG